MTGKRLVAIIILTGVTACTTRVDFASLSEAEKRLPEHALSSMSVAEGLEVDLFASEPMLANPTNLAIDARGRLWITEGRNYRMAHNPDNPYDAQGDRILILEDTNGDGKADKKTVYYQGEDINAALGIAVLGNKVIVSSSPNVFVFTDEDGDDQPDSREVLFTTKGLQLDHGTHAMIFAPDGRLYFNFGNEGKILMDAEGNTITDIHGYEVIDNGKPLRDGMAFRCEPDGSGMEVLGHNFRNPYELTVDSYGGIWQSDNDDDGNRGTRLNYVMEGGNYGYKDELTGAGWSVNRPGMHKDIPKRHWHQNDPGSVPNLLQLGSGSPTGILVYESNQLPFAGQLVHCEPGHNVVRNYPITSQGAGYSSEIQEILKSEDKWFRPADVAAAPDGSLYVVDWYDGGVGGHYAQDVQRGRVYRIHSGNHPTLDGTVESIEQALEGLKSPNMDLFYQSWQFLFSRQDGAKEALESILPEGGVYQARALWLLARIPGQTNAVIHAALEDANENIRMQGIRMAKYLDPDHLVNYLEMVAEDASPAVRREAAIALRYEGSPEAAQLWATLARQYEAGDRWSLEALGIGSDLHPNYFTTWAEGRENGISPADAEIVWRSRASASIPMLAEMIKDPEVNPEMIPSYVRAFHFKPAWERDVYLYRLLEMDHPERTTINALVLGAISNDFVQNSDEARQRVQQILPDIEGTREWLTAIGNLKIKGLEDQLFDLAMSDDELNYLALQAMLEAGSVDFFQSYLSSGVNDQEKREVLVRLGWIGDHESLGLLRSYIMKDTLSFPLMVQAVESMGSSWNGQHWLYDMLVAEEVPSKYKTTAVLKIMNCWDPEVRNNAPKYLEAGQTEIPDLEVLVEQTGDAAAGGEIFARICASCHQVNGEGVRFGPDLSDIANKLSKQSLYSAIIFPSAGINFGFEGYVAKTTEGKTYVGYISSRTESEIALVMMGGITQTIAVDELASLEPADQSLMTANLHLVMEEQELVDLVEYLATLQVDEEVSE